MNARSTPFWAVRAFRRTKGTPSVRFASSWRGRKSGLSDLAAHSRSPPTRRLERTPCLSNCSSATCTARGEPPVRRTSSRVWSSTAGSAVRTAISRPRIRPRVKSRESINASQSNTCVLLSNTRVSVSYVDDSHFGEEIEGGRAAFAVAEPRVLYTTKWHLSFAAYSRDVDVHHPSFRVLGIAKSRTQVAVIDRGGQSVADGVRGGDGALVVVRGDDAHHRSEDLLLRDAHVRIDVGEDRRLDEVARLQVRFCRCAAIANDARALLLPRRDAVAHLTQLQVVDDRPQPDAIREAVARAPRIGLRREQLGEVDEARAHDYRAACRGAALSGRAERAARDALRSLLEVRVVPDDDRVLATHLALHLAEPLGGLCVEASSDGA